MGWEGGGPRGRMRMLPALRARARAAVQCFPNNAPRSRRARGGQQTMYSRSACAGEGLCYVRVFGRQPI